MTQDELESKIKQLTKRIGEAKRRAGPLEELERLRLSRFTLMSELARRFDRWTLVNAQGRTEFVDRATLRSRLAARTNPALATPTDPAPLSSEASTAVSAPRPTPVDDFWGEPIHVYTRAQAIADGVLVDVTPWAQGIFKIPVVLTSALWAVLEDIPHPPEDNSVVSARAREVLAAAAVAGAAKQDSDRATFTMLLQVTSGLRSLDLLTVCGPGDTPDPVVTIGFPIDF